MSEDEGGYSLPCSRFLGGALRVIEKTAARETREAVTWSPSFVCKLCK